MNYLRKYLYRRGIGIFLFAGVCLFFLFIVPDFLAKCKSAIERDFNRRYNQKVLIGKLSYSIPNGIILQDVSFSGHGQPNSSVLFSIKKIKISFSARAFLFKKSFIITKIFFVYPTIYFPDMPRVNFIKYALSVYTDVKQFIEVFIPLVNKRIVRLTVKGGILILPKTAYPITDVKIDSLEIGQKGYILGSGLINTLRYNFKGSFGEKGVVIDNATFKKINCYAKFWGGIDNVTLRLNGFAFLGMFSDYLASDTRSKFGVINKAKEIFARLKGAGSGIIWLSSFGRLNIFGLDCAIKFSPTDVKVEKLAFNVNNTPVFIKGGISFLEKSLVGLNVTFYKNQPDTNTAENPNKSEFELLGNIQEGAFSGKLKFVYPRRLNNKTLYEKAEGRLEGLSIYLNKDKYTQVLFDEGDFEYRLAGALYRISLSKFKGSITSKDKKFRLTFASLLYGGFVNGQCLLDFAGQPFKGQISLSVKDVNSNALSSLLPYLSSFSGKLDSTVYAGNYPVFNLGGSAVINKGVVENLGFLEWLEDFFGMGGFKKLNFDKLSAQFLITNKKSQLKAISLDSQKLGLNGNFVSYNTGLVSGIFFLSVSQDLLKDSNKFKPLLGILGKDVPVIDFDFQLSGVREAMNFKWLESDFKNRLKHLLPGFVERGIERKIEEAVKPISAK